VGTVYVKNSQEKATELAFRYINPKLDDFVIQAAKVAIDGQVAVHCWRGGMRSQSFARHLHEHGFPHVCVISGGYKSYRNYVLNSFNNPADLRIIGGYTGSGKSDIIQYFQEKAFRSSIWRGWQTIKVRHLGE
jgi:tRNA 2-selenouridine synthase